LQPKLFFSIGGNSASLPIKTKLFQQKMIQINNLTKKHGPENLFENVNLVIHKGDRIALIGQNGTGKTTFVNCLIGDDPFYEGTIDIPSGITISVMEQEKEFESSKKNFWDFLKEKKGKIEDSLKKIEKKLGDPKLYSNETEFQKVIQQYERLTRKVEKNIEEKKMREMLEKVNFDLKSFDTPLYKLSGGQKMKLRLAECLIKKADLYILDEPTNHLDFETLEWLDTELTKKETVLIISHDRHLLKRFAKKIIEIENKSFEVYNMDYDSYLIKRAHRHELLKKQHKYITKKKQKMIESVERLRQWLSKGKNRSKRILAERIERQIEELPKTIDPEDLTNKFEISFDNSKRTGNIVFEILGISKKYKNQDLFSKVNVEVERGDKIAIIGANGSGKTTFLRLLSEAIKPDSGTIKTGVHSNIGYFDQELSDLNSSETVIEFFKNNFSDLHEEKLISLAVKYGMPRHTFKQKIKTLSGGEKARLNLLRLVMGRYNVLLLDEPTNNLDLNLVETLENALKEFKGTIVLISHDRYFIDKIAKRLFVIEKGTITTKVGNYSDNF
jgi:ATP-binding cassette subfamily F protein 3